MTNTPHSIAKCDSETKQSWSSSDHYDEIMSLKEDLNNLREVNWNIYEALEQVYDMENFLDDFHDASSEEAKQSKYQMAQRIGEFYERLTLATENNVNVVQLLKELTEASKAWSHRENIEW